jgi:FG-GAP-like repeat/Secretion system C-terminal sorting domain
MNRSILIIAATLLPVFVLAQIEWAEHTVDGDFDGAKSVLAADIDGDSDLDIVGAAYDDRSITWWENLNGSGLEWAEHTVDSDFYRCSDVFADDIDGDGDIDLLGGSWYYVDAITWWENLDGSGLEWAVHSVDSLSSYAASVHAFDMDFDGDSDVLGAAGDLDILGWWENVDGNGIEWIAHVVDLSFDGTTSLYPTDLDSDGDPDLVGAAVNDDEITWFENVDGYGLEWTEHLVDGEFDGVSSVYAMDIDGDSDIDVIGAANSADDVSWWENLDGEGLLWDEHRLDSFYDGAHGVFATDLDGDGDADILGAARSHDEITWWENLDGAGLYWEDHILSNTFNGAECVYSADVNGDGRLDVLGAANAGNEITWWEQPEPQYAELQVIAPNGGEAWRVDTSHNIIWNSSSDLDVVIEFMRGWTVERVITEGTENDGVFEWTVPQEIIPADIYRIRCLLADGSEQDASNAAFAISAPPNVTLTPHNPPLIVPANGGGFFFFTEVNNPTPYPGTGMYWTDVVLPTGWTYGPLIINTLTLEPYGTFAPVDPFPQWVPPYAPSGTYEFRMHVGNHPNIIVATDSFEFEKLAGAGTVSLPESSWSIEDWQNRVWELTGAGQATVENQPLPTGFSVSPAYPNPFNPSTTISVSLPESADLMVTVYNINGQQVAELAHGQFNAGNHTFTFDASKMASGLYFVRATVPGQLDQMQKVVLVR